VGAVYECHTPTLREASIYVQKEGQREIK